MATETSSTGRESDKFMLRFPEGMREQIADAARAAGRTMNAEVVDRLADTLDPEKREQIQALKERVFELDRKLGQEELMRMKERTDTLVSQLLAVRLAALADPEALKRQPDLAVAARSLLDRKDEIMLDMMEATIVGMARSREILTERVESGAIKVVPSDDSKKPSILPGSIQRTTTTLVEAMETMDPGLLNKLFNRPAVRELYEKFDAGELGPADDAPGARPKPRTRKPKP